MIEAKTTANQDGTTAGTVRKIAVVGDIHVKDSDQGQWTAYFKAVSQQADVLVICGDLTDTGRLSEAQVLCEELRACAVPVVAVLGNHDHEHDEQEDIAQALTAAGVYLLEGDYVVVSDIGFAGVKGFGGGFDRRMLSMFGEREVKAFVQAAVDEELRLETALNRLDTEHSDVPKIVVLHYSPIAETVVGEAEQIFPFLGCSRLAVPLEKQKVMAAFHGHAHIGTLRGQTPLGVPVFNVAMPLLHRDGYEPAFFLYEVPIPVSLATSPKMGNAG